MSSVVHIVFIDGKHHSSTWIRLSIGGLLVRKSLTWSCFQTCFLMANLCFFLMRWSACEKKSLGSRLSSVFFACEEAFLRSDAVKTASILFYHAFRACQKAKHTRDSNNIQYDFMLSFSSIFLIHICSPDRPKSRWLVQRHVNSNREKWKFAQRLMRCAEWAHFLRALSVGSKTAKTHKNGFWRASKRIYFEFRRWLWSFKQDSRVSAHFWYSKWDWHAFRTESMQRNRSRFVKVYEMMLSELLGASDTFSDPIFDGKCCVHAVQIYFSARLGICIPKSHWHGSHAKQASIMIFSDTKMQSNMYPSM